MLKTQYGITRDEFEALFEAQGGACAICRTEQLPVSGAFPSTQWNVDHHHESGTIRGILCSLCNWGLGQFRDSPDLLRAAIAYLER
jgi:hypothetical protein